jgi:hypothetical protein
MEGGVRGEALFRNIDYRLARTKEERTAIYALRYRSYLKAGMVSESDDQRVTDKYDEAPNSWIFGVYVADKLRGSIRLQLLTKECRTAFNVDVYGDILNPRLDQGEVFVDASRFVGDPDFDMVELPYVIMRLGFLMCERFGADTGSAAVTEEHVRFHERFFLYKPLTEAREFPGLVRKSLLMAANFKVDKEEVLSRFPILRSSAFERRMLFGTDQPLPAAA